MYRRGERQCRNWCWDLRETDHWGQGGVEARMKIKVNRLVGKSWCKCKGKYKIDQVVVREWMDWIDLVYFTDTWRRLVYFVMFFWVPLGPRIISTACETISFWRRFVHSRVNRSKLIKLIHLFDVWSLIWGFVILMS